VKLGLTDSMVTELAGGELEPGAALVAATMREAQPDFVSGFISKVTSSKK